jgi:hypothetical protein
MRAIKLTRHKHGHQWTQRVLRKNSQFNFGWHFSPSRHMDQYTLCNRALQRKINLPKDLKVLYVQFTKESQGDMSWPIWIKQGHYGPKARIKGWTGDLHGGAVRLIEKAHEEGMRFVHLEYNE